ncbi:MAG: hypothetical protein U0797_24285 [Gemmataceae bacterium]
MTTSTLPLRTVASRRASWKKSSPVAWMLSAFDTRTTCLFTGAVAWTVSISIPSAPGEPPGLPSLAPSRRFSRRVSCWQTRWSVTPVWRLVRLTVTCCGTRGAGRAFTCGPAGSTSNWARSWSLLRA